MYRLVNGQLLNIIEVVTPNQIALVTTTAHSVQGYESDVAITIESIPEKNEPAGKIGELHFLDGVLVWVYVDKPPTVDDEVIKLKAENEQLKQRFALMDADFVGFQQFYFEKNPGDA